MKDARLSRPPAADDPARRKSGRLGALRRFGARAAFVALAVAVIAACARDREAALRSRLGELFFLGETEYFDSQIRCTGAMFRVTVDRPRIAMAIERHPDHAKAALSRNGVAAIQIDGMSPAELTDKMLLDGDGAFGKEALRAAALSGNCFEDREVNGLLHQALTRPGALILYDRHSEGLMILNSQQYRLFYIAGDIW